MKLHRWNSWIIILSVFESCCYSFQAVVCFSVNSETGSHRRTHLRPLFSRRRPSSDESFSKHQQKIVAVQQEIQLLNRLQGNYSSLVTAEEDRLASSQQSRRRQGVAQETLERLISVPSKSDESTRAEENINGKIQPQPVIDRWNRNGSTLSSSVVTVPLERSVMNTDVATTTTSPDGVLLRLVVISDTHGFEEQLFGFNENDDFLQPQEPFLLPPADILVHCGDFSGSGCRQTKRAIQHKLDQFLAAQTHIPLKLVVRGNHDMHVVSGRKDKLFPLSNANYITRSTTLQHANITIGVRPFSRKGHNVLLPPCDILLTHEPPRGVLDRTYQGLHVGSKSLLSAVQESHEKPRLWLCGHIHEGRGSRLCSWGSESAATTAATLVLNAANANSGRARQVVAGPAIVEVVDTYRDAEVRSAWHTACKQAHLATSAASSHWRGTQEEGSLQALVAAQAAVNDTENGMKNRRLLAVDLGLRTTTVLLDQSGQIIEVNRFRLTDLPSLEAALRQVLNTTIEGDNNVLVTHAVVSSDDWKLFRIWKQAVERQAPMVLLARVFLDDWKDHFLTKSERKNRQAEQSAIVRMAKQLYSRQTKSQDKTSDNRLVKDAAEAILVGYYAIGLLGWVDNGSL